MEKKIDWSKINKDDVLPEIPCGDAPFPSGGKVEKVERGVSLYDGAVDDFWIRYPAGLYRFTIISGKIHALGVDSENGK